LSIFLETSSRIFPLENIWVTPSRNITLKKEKKLLLCFVQIRLVLRQFSKCQMSRWQLGKLVDGLGHCLWLSLIRKLLKYYLLEATFYCEQTSKWNIDGVIQNSLFKTMMMCKGLPGFFISNGKKGKESRIEERQRERMCVRGRALQQEKDSVGHKKDC
jgi:hypothetical protein